MKNKSVDGTTINGTEKAYHRPLIWAKADS